MHSSVLAESLRLKPTGLTVMVLGKLQIARPLVLVSVIGPLKQSATSPSQVVLVPSDSLK